MLEKFSLSELPPGGEPIPLVDYAPDTYDFLHEAFGDGDNSVTVAGPYLPDICVMTGEAIVLGASVEAGGASVHSVDSNASEILPVPDGEETVWFQGDHLYSAGHSGIVQTEYMDADAIPGYLLVDRRAGEDDDQISPVGVHISREDLAKLLVVRRGYVPTSADGRPVAAFDPTEYSIGDQADVQDV